MQLRSLTYFILLILLVSSLSSCKLSRFVYHNFADINDHKIFPARVIAKGETSFKFPYADLERKPKSIKIDNKSYDFESFLGEHKSVAFIIIERDSIVYERYFNKYNDESIVPSFSMAKSITSILIGIAIDEGLIQSVEEPITNYIPELKKNGFEKVKIEHLLQMTSGLDFNEGYFNPFGEVATFYYGTNLRKSIAKLKLKREPGLEMEYVSGNTQLLGLVLERALKGRTVSSYLEEKIWQPLEMEFDASWSIDRRKDGIEKTFCCVNATARDYAKIGRLFLHQGNWNGKQIVSKSWVEQSTKIDSAQGSSKNYQYQWWLPTENGDYMAKGILGQYIYVHPAKDLIIVRLGKDKDDQDWETILSKIGEAW